MTALLRPARCAALISIALLAACAAPQPATLTDLTQGFARVCRLDQVPSYEDGSIRMYQGFDVLVSDGIEELDVPFVGVEDIDRLRYHFVPGHVDVPPAERTLLGSTAFLDDHLDPSHALATLAAAGVTPRAVHGVLSLGPVKGASVQPSGPEHTPRDPRITLLVSTSRPDVYLGFREGRPTLYVTVLDARFFEYVPGWLDAAGYASLLGELPELDLAPGVLSVVASPVMQDVPVDGLRPLAELARVALDTRRRTSLDGLAAARAAWDARLAQAGLDDGLALFAEVHEIVAGLIDGTGVVLPEAVSWEERARSDWISRCSSEFATFESSRVTGKCARNATRALGRFDREGLDGFRTWLGLAREWHALRDDDPVQESELRFRWLCALDDDPDAPGHDLVDGGMVDLSDALRVVAEAKQTESFVRGWSDGLQNTFWFLNDAGRRKRERPAVQSMYAVYDALGPPPTSWEAELTRLRVVVAERPKLLDSYNATVRRPAKSLPDDCAAHVRALVPSLTDPTEALLARGLADALERDDDLRAVDAVAELSVVARAWDDSGSLSERIDRVDALAARHVTLGSLAFTVARALGHPAARELAATAHDLEAEQPAVAAAVYFDAATLGLPECPAGISSRTLTYEQMAWFTGQPSGVDAERDDWLRRARTLALHAVGESLPAVSAGDPVFRLWDRYVGRQLGGDLELARRIGVRLGGAHDVTGFAGRPPSTLRLLGGAPRWTEDASVGEPVDLEAYAIDQESWDRLPGLAGDLEVARVDLEASRSALHSDLPTLEQQRDGVDARSAELLAQVQAGSVPVDEAQRQIDALKQESASLSFAIRNYNSRQTHFNERVNAFNERVNEYNALLFELNAQLATAFTELLGPATDAASDAWLAAAPLTDEEREARRWLLGKSDARSPLRVTRAANGADVGQALRFATDPVRAARILSHAWNERRTDTRLHPGGTDAQRVHALAPAIGAYLTSYGAPPFVEHVLREQLSADRALEDLVLAELRRDPELDERREGLQRALGR
ncbi:MAG: hypothetical protein H6825_03145 [Planctomycetes bacterium]|nr:hypothetical protein [Planctomycetota bacterium]